MATATMGHAPRAERAKLVLTGWSVFAGVVLLVVGGFNLINGFTAINHAGYFTSQIVYSNLTAWGWVFVVWGILQLLAGALTLARNTAGSYLGVFLAGTASILWFFMIFAAPWAALVGVTTSLLVIYGLTAGAHPDDF